MTEVHSTMFGDRRTGSDRREQNLPMPALLDRRADSCSRRNRQFQSQPWWLRIDYAEELVSEKLVSAAAEVIEEQRAIKITDSHD